MVCVIKYVAITMCIWKSKVLMSRRTFFIFFSSFFGGFTLTLSIKKPSPCLLNTPKTPSGTENTEYLPQFFFFFFFFRDKKSHQSFTQIQSAKKGFRMGLLLADHLVTGLGGSVNNSASIQCSFQAFSQSLILRRAASTSPRILVSSSFSILRSSCSKVSCSTVA